MDQFGDTTITVRQIKIKNIERWNKMEAKDFVAKGDVGQAEDERMRARSAMATSGNEIIDSFVTPYEAEVDETVINCKTDITYHQLYEFGKLFQANQLGLQMLEQSFSPESNRE